MIQTIQIGVETVIIPPGSLGTDGAMLKIVVVVTIFCGERRTTMMAKWVTGSSYKITQNENITVDIMLIDICYANTNAFRKSKTE